MASKQHQWAHLITLVRCCYETWPFTIIAKMHSNKFKIMDNSTHVIEVAHVNCFKKVCLPQDESFCEPKQSTDDTPHEVATFSINSYCYQVM